MYEARQKIITNADESVFKAIFLKQPIRIEGINRKVSVSNHPLKFLNFKL